MKIYVDKEYHCHTVNDGTMREVETPVFDGWCSAKIEGYCYDDRNGYVSVYPWKPYTDLEREQKKYDKALIADMQNALNKLGVTLDE